MALITPQLIISGIDLPQTDYNRYQCYPIELGQQIDMISGRRVTEVRGHVQRIVYSYDYWPESLWVPVSQILRSGASFTVNYLADDSAELQAGTFITESLSNPVFAFGQYGKAFWHNIAFTLREVAPHD